MSLGIRWVFCSPCGLMMSQMNIEYDTHLVIVGGIRPYCWHGRDTQSLGVCRSLQAAASISECVGRYRLFVCFNLSHTQLLLRLFFSGQINNAGCMVHKRELNAEGLEKNFATNTMGEASFWGSNSAAQRTLLTLWLHIFSGVHPHPHSHSTSPEEPGSQGGMSTNTLQSTHKHSAGGRHADHIKPPLYAL